jgi:tRNA pseudouridine55 synthase
MKLNILNQDQLFPSEFPKGALLLVDKPLGWTSFDAVNKIRYMLVRRLGLKKLKVGHAGTLDPLANGLLVICVGDYTKRIDEFQGLPKEYTGTLTFGATTASFDLEKPVDNTFPTDQLSDSRLAELLGQFTGDIQQVPPIYSAVKVDGKRLYKNARTGEIVEIAPRSVNVSVFELAPLRPVPTPVREHVILSSKGAEIHLYPDYESGLQADFRVVCSKGTYIRSLAHDIGQAAECGAYLSALRRTKIGDFDTQNAWSMEDLTNWIKLPQ